MKTVYQTNEDGVFVGTSQAQESPLEPGEFLMPRNSYEDAPPKHEEGKQVCVRVGEAWKVIDLEVPAPPDVGVLLEFAKERARAIRKPMLDALTGIAGRAERNGDSALASEADRMTEELLNITGDSELLSATDAKSMELAVRAAYKRIAAAASPALAVVFREITGA